MASVEEKKAGRIVVSFWSILVQVTTFLFYSLVYFARYTPGFTRAIRFQGLAVTLPGCSSVTLTSGMERGGDGETGKGKECWRTSLSLAGH